MKRLVLTGLVLFAGFSGGAMAACTGGFLNGAAVNTLLSNKTACSPAGCSGANCTWQEQHLSSGVLQDFKKGPSDPVDPTSPVGTWRVSTTGNTNGKITHSYTGDTSYTYDVKDNGGGLYSFCGGGPEITFSVKNSISAGCP